MSSPFATSQIRNIALVGHGGAGKTSLGEALLFMSGATARLGSVMDETSVLDLEPEEHKRKGSIASKLAWLEWSGCKINLLDTPGDGSFLYDTFAAMRGADAAVVVLSAPDGVEVQTERVWRTAGELGLARVVFINKMDRERADPDGAIAQVRELFGVRPVPIEVPIGREGSFRGVVDLFEKRAIYPEKSGSGRSTTGPVPPELLDEVEGAWHNLVEAIAETDEALLEQYLETFELSPEQIRTGFHQALRRGRLTPILYGSATHTIGARALLDLVTWALPCPTEHPNVLAQKDDQPSEVTPDPEGNFVAQVLHTTIDDQAGKISILRIFRGKPPEDGHLTNASRGGDERLGALFTLRGKDRTSLPVAASGDIVCVSKLREAHTGDTLTAPSDLIRLDAPVWPAPMMAYVVRPLSKGDGDRIRTALDRAVGEDPTLSVSIDETTHEIVLSGVGQAQLDMAIDRMRRKYKLQVETALPPIPYRETIRRSVSHVEGKHKKQTGGAGQFGQCVLDIAPLPRGGGFEFVDAIKGGAIPNQYIPSVEKGIVQRMKSGFLAGYPIVDLRVVLVDGKYHPVDSKDVAFQMAGSKGLRAAFQAAGTMLLEPVMDLEIVVPTETMGAVMGDITGRRGRVTGMDPRGRNTVVTAHVPLAEVRRYAPELRGLTGGKGAFSMKLAGYEEVPAHLVERVVKDSPFPHVVEEED